MSQNSQRDWDFLLQGWSSIFGTPGQIYVGTNRIALSPSFKWENQSQLLGVKLGIFTTLVRCCFKLLNILLLRNDRKKMYESLIYPIKGREFQWSTGYEFFGILYNFDAKEKLINLVDSFDGQDRFLYLHPSIIGWSM